MSVKTMAQGVAMILEAAEQDGMPLPRQAGVFADHVRLMFDTPEQVRRFALWLAVPDTVVEKVVPDPISVWDIVTTEATGSMYDVELVCQSIDRRERVAS